MMSLSVASAQYPITFHRSFSDWALHVESWVSDATSKGAQLLIFPEYGSMELVSTFPELLRLDIQRQINELDAIKDDYCTVFAKLAQKYHVVIIAPSIPIIDGGRNVNRVYVFSEKGLVGYQDKFFMTRFENEEWGIAAGEKILTLFETPKCCFGIQICYDVEFGLGSQILAGAGASLILAPSCTETIRGATRVHVGARARALENQCYSVVSQTVGSALWSPAVDINYGFAAYYTTPDTQLPEDGILSTMEPQKEGWLVQELDFSKIENVRTNGQVFNFRDHQRIQVAVTGKPTIVRRVLLDL
jgi:predicted amidohydrolase